MQGDSEQVYELIEVSNHRILKTDHVKLNNPYCGLLRFNFSKTGRYFIQESGEDFAIVDLGDFYNFFKPDFDLEAA